ncbi:hypothetical protein DY000_02032201 [Brassica cretica]|uniref:Uncharacterized protein n=1 Tax=Brassica cretica TaxID=69181 RepID=A0ABQ7DNZ4_BRACR|nr:hypothetical protein DY000_02032201 [Brassica cretica]
MPLDYRSYLTDGVPCCLCGELRNIMEGAIGYHLAKAAYEGMREVRYTNLKSKMIDNSELSYVLANTDRFIDSIARGGSHCLAQDTFFLEYDLRANLLGKLVYGELHCLGLSFRVDWVLQGQIIHWQAKKGEHAK